MEPRDFIEQVVDANLYELRSNPGCMRSAVNAILVVDAAAGIIAYVENLGSFSRDQDTKVRNELSSVAPAFQLVRDAAFSLKHGFLSGSERTVSDIKQLKECESRWSDVAVWSDAAAWADDLIVLETTPEIGCSIRADVAVSEAREAVLDRLNKTVRNYHTLKELAQKGVLQ
jgi:hypothetical protein